MTTEDPDDIVRIATATSPAQAYIWREALQDAGISCRVVGDYLDAGIGDVPGMSPEVWVHRSDADKAARVLGRDAE